MSPVERGFQFEPEWRTTLLVVVLLPILVGLGFWQIQRAEEKTVLADTFAQRQQRPPAPLEPLWDVAADELAYMPVRMRGRFLRDQYLLLDNRLRNGQFGYEVVGIFRLENGDGVLVNRGWIAGDAARQSLPLVPPVKGTVELAGHIYVAPGAPYLLAEQQFTGEWPQRIQAIEMDFLGAPVAEVLGGRVFPYPVRINAGAPGALAVAWEVINVSPQKHRGYAVQWFAMAAVLLVFYILRSSRFPEWLRGSRETEG